MFFWIASVRTKRAASRCGSGLATISDIHDSTQGDVKLPPRRQTCESRTSVFGVSFGCGLCRAVVFAGEVEEFGFDRFHSGLVSLSISP